MPGWKTPCDERAALESQALAWIVRLTSGEATLEDAEAFRRWRGQSLAHARALAEMARVWSASRPAAEAIARRMGREPLRPMSAGTPMSRRALLAGALAAGAGAYLVVHPPLQLWPDWSSLTADLRTGIGEQRQIVLGAVVVDLNTRTSINVRRADTGEVAALELVTGEAQVRLPSGLPLPFVVTAGAGEVTASGAARFNVRATGPSVCVTCLEGAIELRRADRILVARAAQQITYSGSQEALMTVADPAIVTAWRERMLIFNDEPLTAVVDEINRYRPGRIIVTNAELGRRRVQAQVRLDQLAEVVELIRVGYGAKVTTLPAGIVLLS